MQRYSPTCGQHNESPTQSTTCLQGIQGINLGHGVDATSIQLIYKEMNMVKLTKKPTESNICPALLLTMPTPDMYPRIFNFMTQHNGAVCQSIRLY